MSTITKDKRATGGVKTRILREGYGEGAWHGPDLKAALADVTPDAAFQRPAPGRHNIAEIALHHAYCVRGVRAKLSGIDADPFVLDGDDWFDLSDSARLPWPRVLQVVELEQKRLAECVAGLESHGPESAPTESECVDLVLGITCHAVYHAGQIQLIKRLQR